MARKPKAGPAPQGRAKGGGNPILRNLGLIVLAVPLLFLFMPTVLFLSFAMLPTFVAVIIDKGNRRYGGITVGGLNFAGAAPYVLDMWLGTHDIAAALALLSDVFALMLIYGCAGFGWLLYTGTPSTMTAVMSMTATRRLAALRAKQKALVDEWGQEVTTQDPLPDDIGSARKG
jgi:hypothetical protein